MFTNPERIDLQFLHAGFVLKFVSSDSMLLPVFARRSNGTNLSRFVSALVREDKENAGRDKEDIYLSS